MASSGAKYSAFLSLAIVCVISVGAFLSASNFGHAIATSASTKSQDQSSVNERTSGTKSSSATTSSTTTSTSSSDTSSSSSTTTYSDPSQSRNSLIWVFTDYNSTLQSIYDNPGSFNTVSPYLYSIDSAGQFQGNTSFDEAIESSIINHDLLVWPVIGSSSDSNIANLTSCLEYQNQFIDAAINAASFSLSGQTYSINGYNIDFEPSQSITSGATYTVQSGDYLSLIGQKCGVSWQSIASANGIVSPYTITPGEVLIIPNSTPIYQLFDQFMSNFAQALHQKGMVLSVDVAPWNVIQSEAPYNGGVFWDYAGLASAVNYVVEMDYVSYFCYNSSGQRQNSDIGCVYKENVIPGGYIGDTFYDQYVLTRQFVPASKIMIGLESIACGADGGAGSNCLAGEEISFLVDNGISAIGIWPSGVFLTTNGLSTSPYPSNYDWFMLSEAFIKNQN
ncbi:MAG: LysM peptidoglycan-binding domain-containing protein [archaeon]|nr:LysM peptidoglycan-binding domain-containing protein [archaeon]